jgi:hypothetical protein
MQTEIPPDDLARAEARVDQLLEALRAETERLAPLADSALVYHPAQEADRAQPE